MKKILIIIVLFVVVSINGQTDDKNTITQLNQQTVTLYKNGNLDEALKTAKKSLELTLKTYGVDTQESYLAYTNLGTLQREKRNYDEAIKNLQTALEIYRKQSNFSNARLIEMYQTLGLTQFLGGKKKDAEASYLLAINTTETVFGESKELFLPTLNAANLYARLGDFVKADEFYLKSYRLAIKKFGEESKEIEDVADARVCLNVDNKKRDSLFETEYNKIFDFKPTKPEEIVNGKSIKLIKPPYPQEAKEKRLTGEVKIRVKIDEQGNVIEARSACGKGILEKAAEEAAWLCKFSPTLLNKKPVQVSGVIIYRFSAQ